MAVAQWIGQWAWVIAPWFWVVMYDPEWFPNADTATRSLAVWVGISCMLLAMIPAIFIKSKSTLGETSFSPLTLKSMGSAIMTLVDFNPDAGVQADGAVSGLRFFYSAIPITGTLIAMWVMRDYDLTEQKAREIAKQLEERKA